MLPYRLLLGLTLPAFNLAAMLLPVQSLNDQLVARPFPGNTTSLTLNPDIAEVSDDRLGVGNPRVKCSPRTYGTDLNAHSCYTSVFNIVQEEHVAHWRARARRRPGLPYRWLSSDGTCSVSLYLIAPNTDSHVSFEDIWRAAHAIYDDCISRIPPIGGVATNIGGDNKLAVVIRKHFYPNVACDEIVTGITMSDVGSIVDSMDAEPGNRRFGPRSDPTSEIIIPFTFESADGSHVAIVSGQSDVTSWYRIWESVSAISSRCVVLRRAGVELRLGREGKLMVALMERRQGILKLES